MQEGRAAHDLEQRAQPERDHAVHAGPAAGGGRPEVGVGALGQLVHARVQDGGRPVDGQVDVLQQQPAAPLVEVRQALLRDRLLPLAQRHRCIPAAAACACLRPAILAVSSRAARCEHHAHACGKDVHNPTAQLARLHDGRTLSACSTDRQPAQPGWTASQGLADSRL